MKRFFQLNVPVILLTTALVIVMIVKLSHRGAAAAAAGASIAAAFIVVMTFVMLVPFTYLVYRAWGYSRVARWIAGATFMEPAVPSA